MEKVFKKRLWRLVTMGICSIVILVVGLVLVSVAKLKNIGDLNSMLNVYAVTYPIFSFLIYCIFDLRTYVQEENTMTKKFLTGTAYALLWLVFAVVAIVVNLFVYTSVADNHMFDPNYKSYGNLQWFVTVGMAPYAITALIYQAYLQYCDGNGWIQRVEKRQKIAPFTSLISFVITLVIFGFLGTINNKTIRQGLLLLSGALGAAGFIVVLIKKFKNRGQKAANRLASQRGETVSSSHSSSGYAYQSKGVKTKTTEGKSILKRELESVANSYNKHWDSLGNVDHATVNVSVRLSNHSIDATVDIQFTLGQPADTSSEAAIQDFMEERKKLIKNYVDEYRNQISSQIVQDVETTIRNIQADYDDAYLNGASFRVTCHVKANF